MQKEPLMRLKMNDDNIYLSSEFLDTADFDPNNFRSQAPPANMDSKIEGGGTFLATYRICPRSISKALLTYSIMAEDSSTRDYFVKVTVLPNTTGITGIPSNGNDFKVWPNPTMDAVHFEQPSDVRLYNMQSVLILSKQAVSTLSVQGLAAGTYIIINKQQKQSILVQ